MTGAEALQKILENVENLNKVTGELKISIQLIEANIKILNNRAAGLMLGNMSAMETVPALANEKIVLPNTHQTVTSRGRKLSERAKTIEPNEEAAAPDSNILTYKKVFGKLKGKDSEPEENVLVKVFDKNNEVCATTETDPIGYFETMLRPGKYVAEYTKVGFKTSNKTFEVGKYVKEVEIK